MSKLIYITEAQLQEIVGNGAYLNKQDTTNEFKFGGAEVNVNSTTGSYLDGDLESGDPVTSDELADTLSTQSNLRTQIGSRTLTRESNHNIEHNHIGLSDKSKQTAQQLGIDASDMDVNYGLVVTNRIEKGNYNGKVSKKDLVDLNNDVSNKCQTQMTISRNDRKAKMARGENVMKSAPKTGAKGGAHTPKGNNVIGVTYEK